MAEKTAGGHLAQKHKGFLHPAGLDSGMSKFGDALFAGKKPPEAPGVGTPNMNAIGTPHLLTYVLQ